MKAFRAKISCPHPERETRVPAAHGVGPGPRSRRVGTGGFTLIELLVVIGIILLMIGLSAHVAQNLGRGQGVDNAITTLQNQVNAARSLAMARGTDARLLISNKTGGSDEEKDRYLNYSVVVYRARTDNGSSTPTYEWRADGNGISMPAGARFSPQYSEGWADFGDDKQNLGSQAPVISRAFSGYSSGDWISYGFDASGTPINEPQGDRLDLIVQANTGLDSSGQVTVRKKNENLVGGIAITRYGTTLQYRDAKHVSDITGHDFVGN